MTALPLRYPILALVPDYEPDLVVGREQLEVHFNEDWFTAVPVWHLKKGTRAGVLLVDLEGRNWRIAKVSDQGAIGETFWKRIFGRVRRVQFDLSEEPPVSFDELKGRVCNSDGAGSRPTARQDGLPGTGETFSSNSRKKFGRRTACLS